MALTVELSDEEATVLQEKTAAEGMTALFADTFYWIALTLPGDSAYARAQQFTDDIVTTEEVSTEYLTFFSDAPEYIRREVAANVEAMLSPSVPSDASVVRIIRDIVHDVRIYPPSTSAV